MSKLASRNGKGRIQKPIPGIAQICGIGNDEFSSTIYPVSREPQRKTSK